MNKSPIFIVGTSRSGTTLISRIVNNSPEVAVFPEPTKENCIADYWSI